MDYYGPASQREQYFRNMGLNPDGTPLGSAPAPAPTLAPPVDPAPSPMAGPSPYAQRPQPQWGGVGPMMGQGKNPFGGGGGLAGGYRQLMRPAQLQLQPQPQQSFSSFSPMSGGMDAPQRPGPRRSASASSFSGSPFSGAPAPAPAPVPSFSSSDSMAVTPPQRQPLTRRGPTPW